MRMMKRFISYYRPYKKLFFLDFFSAVVVAALEITFPVIVNIILRDYLPQENIGEQWVMILAAVGALFSFYIISAALQYVVTYFGHKLGILIETDLRRDLFNHLTQLPFGFYDNHKTGELMSRMTTDLFEIGELAHHGPEDVFIALVTFFASFYLMYQVHPLLAFLSVVLVPIIATLIIYFNKRMTRVNRRIYSRLANFSAGLENSISGMRVVQSFANESFEAEKFKHINDDYKNAKLSFYHVAGLSLTTNHFLIRLLSLIALVSSSYFYMIGSITEYNQVVYFILLTNVMVKPIEKMNQVVELYPKGIAGFRRYMDLMDINPTIKDKPDAYAVESLLGDITYHNVSFAYDDGASVLKDVNLEIKAGQTVAFVGPSGAGKTTICNLLPRFYDTTDGYITVDGHPIKDLKLESLRQNMGMVQQDVYLFSGTIKENILYGKLDATDEQVNQVIKLANLEQVIYDAPNGLETTIGDRGVKLSGGQKQRIAIARMFLKNPPILILDEATSALDSTTEALIQESLEKLSVGRTTLVIAHRLSTIQHADKIVVVTKEGIAEVGTHQELLAKGGEYAKLYKRQFYQI